jgi:hypothetical protein
MEIWKKGKLNSEMIRKIWKIYVTQKDFLHSHHILLLPSHHLLLTPSRPPPPPPPPLTYISNVVFQTLRFEKVREKSTGKCNVLNAYLKKENEN